MKTTAISQWNSAYTTLKTTSGHYSTTSCGQNLSCLTSNDSHLSTAMTMFANQIQTITMPPAAAPAANAVVADANKVAQDLYTLSQVTDISLYQGTYSGTGVNLELQRFQLDVSNFATALSNS